MIVAPMSSEHILAVIEFATIGALDTLRFVVVLLHMTIKVAVATNCFTTDIALVTQVSIFSRDLILSRIVIRTS